MWRIQLPKQSVKNHFILTQVIKTENIGKYSLMEIKAPLSAQEKLQGAVFILHLSYLL